MGSANLQVEVRPGFARSDPERAPMRALFLIGLFLLPLAPAPAGAQPAAEVASSSDQRRRDLLHRFGARLKQAVQTHRTFERLCEVASDEQVAVFERLRISPKQARDLLKLFSENMPEGPLDDAGWKALRRKITPQAEDILGSEQFDTLLELVPSPQQQERIKVIFGQLGQTPEGKQALLAADELAAALTPEQARWMDPVLGLLKHKAPPLRVEKKKNGPRPKAPRLDYQRRLVHLRKDSLGDCYAEVEPEFDYALVLPRTYRIAGADADILSALSSSEGLPTRVLGHFKGDLLTVAKNSLLGPPSLLAVEPGRQAWHGRLPARKVSETPLKLEVEVGRGQKLESEVGPDEKGALPSLPGSEVWAEGNWLVQGGNSTLVDARFQPLQWPQDASPASCLIQLSDEFLHRAAREYVVGHPDQLSGGKQVRVRVSDLGATLLDCAAGQVRVFGRLNVSHTGLEAAEAQFEMLVQPEFEKDRLRVRPVPGSLQIRTSFPLYGAVPSTWLARAEKILGPEYSQGISLDLPSEMRQKVVDSGILEQAQLEQLKLYTWPSGDRRTGLITLATPSNATVSAEVLRPRLSDPGEYNLVLSEDAINTALQKKIPPMLPIRRPIPEHLRNQDGVKLNEVEIPELDLAFKDGQFEIRNCVVHVHWSYALFSGVEPAARLRGKAEVKAEGSPARPKVYLNIEQVDFLSTRITERSASEQQKLKDRLVQALRDNPLEASEVPTELEVKQLSPRARLQVTSIQGRRQPSELVLQGRLAP